MFRLRTLGGAALLRDGSALDSVTAQRKMLALLAILAVARDRGISRDRIASYLWSESDMDRARGALKQALHMVRRRLGGDAVLGTAELRLNPEHVQTDVNEFLSALEAGDHERAIDLYGGPFLDGFHLAGAAEFEQWADGQRDDLARRQAEALEGLARAAEAANESGDAVRLWRRLQAHDPFNARAAAGVARALDATGQRAEALRALQAYGALVREELGTEPDAAVTTLALSLRAAPRQPDASGTRAPQQRESREKPASSVVEPPAEEPATAPGEPRAEARRGVGRRAGIGLAATLLAAAALIFAVWITIARDAGAPAAPPEASVAVLPFVNTSGDAAADHFSDGLTDELISRLGSMPGMRVAARTSTFALKNRGLTASAIADTLNVATLLEGTVRRDGDRLKITAQLIRAADNSVIWSEMYDRQMQDVFAVQEDIARAIAGALSGRAPLRAAEDRLGRPTADLEAYDLYLRGRYNWQMAPRDRLRQATTYYHRAVERDPDFALAHAGLAESYVNLAIYDHMPANEALARARIAAERALELDPDLVEALSAHAYVLMSELDFQGAEADIRRAIALNPSYPWAHHFLSLVLLMIGRPEEAASHNQQALLLDPLSLPANATRGVIRAQLGQLAAAGRELERARELAPQFTLTAYYLGAVRAASGAPAAALSALETASREAPDYPGVPGALAAVQKRLGRTSVADSILGDLERRRADPRARTNLAFAHAMLGDTDAAFRALDGSRWDVPALIGLRADPLLAGLRSDPRYARLLQSLGAQR